VLQKHEINTVLLTGVNTNSCVLSTATSACSRDYGVIVVKACENTMDGPDLHEAALKCIRTAFGWVMSSQQLLVSLMEETKKS
jgi:ureidoacrylate peracid hydrolase